VKNRDKSSLWILFSLILPVLVGLLWYFITKAKLVPELLLPPPGKVAAKFIEELARGRLQGDIGISLRRVLFGYLLASAVGIVMGVVMGMWRIFDEFFTLTFTAVRQIPMMAWVPLLIMWFGIGEESKIAVIFLASYFPILMNTMSGIKRTDPKLLEVGRMFQLGKLKMFLNIYLPSALPNVFVGLKLGLGISWMAVVGAEMIAASSGIGFRLNDARSLMQFPIVFSGMIAIALVGVIMDWILTFISRLATPWEAVK
jgi:sulfonate transport system permease protein